MPRGRRARARRSAPSDAELRQRFDADETSTACSPRAPRRSMPNCALPGSAASATSAGYRCSRSAATAAASCSRNPTSTCWCWRAMNRRRRSAPHPMRWRASGRAALGCRPAGQPRGALARAVHAGRGRHHRADRDAGGAPAGRRCRGVRTHCRPRSRRRWCGRRRRILRGQARGAARAPRALTATPPTTSSRTSRKAPAACATCRRCTGWRCASSERADLESLVALGQLGADEHATLERERRALSRLRFGLHLVAGKREERLRFDHQKLLAARLGHVDTADNLAVEQMMQGFYRSAALVLRIGERLLQRFEEQLEGEAVPQPLDALFELRRGYLAARDPALAAHARRAVRAVRGVGVARRRRAACIRRPRARWPRRCRRCPATSRPAPALRQRFMQLLRGPHAGRHADADGAAGRARALDLRRSRTCPGACSSTCSMSTRSTSTRWRCCKNIASFASGQPDERFALAHEVWPRLRKPRTAAARRPVPRHRQGPRRRPFRTRRGRRARVLPGARPVRAATPRWSSGWCASTC